MEEKDAVEDVAEEEGEEEFEEDWEEEEFTEDDPFYVFEMGRKIFQDQNFPLPDYETFSKEYSAKVWGTTNPQDFVSKAFWKWMIISGSCAYSGKRSYVQEDETANKNENTPLKASDIYHLAPAWCFKRFGQSLTVLPDGRRVFIAGEHEDSYDPDFFIYNDVIVVSPEGEVEHIYGYPQNIFPPTDFHAAVYVPSQNEIWIIGSVGYPHDRKEGETPVYKLSLEDWSISKVTTTGELPGWICKAKGVFDADSNTITLKEGEVFINSQPYGTFQNNSHTFVLSLSTLVWRRAN